MEARQQVVGGGRDGTVKFWDCRQSQLKKTIDAKNGTVYSIQVITILLLSIEIKIIMVALLLGIFGWPIGVCSYRTRLY